MKPNKAAILAAAKADMIPVGTSGMWGVDKFRLSKDLEVDWEKRRHIIPAGSYTQLWRVTQATLHQMGELVMTDKPQELNTHLDFMLRAHGDVLITGLGLGCVLRGCLANPNVTRCIVIERDIRVIGLVRPYLQPDRFDIIHSDALEFVKQMTPGHYDCAWHDVWSDPDQAEPHLQVIHSGLLTECADKVSMQGAWAFPRHQKRLWKKHTNLI